MHRQLETGNKVSILKTDIKIFRITNLPERASKILIAFFFSQRLAEGKKIHKLLTYRKD